MANQDCRSSGLEFSTDFMVIYVSGKFKAKLNLFHNVTILIPQNWKSKANQILLKNGIEFDTPAPSPTDNK